MRDLCYGESKRNTRHYEDITKEKQNLFGVQGIVHYGHMYPWVRNAEGILRLEFSHTYGTMPKTYAGAGTSECREKMKLLQNYFSRKFRMNPTSPVYAGVQD